MRYDVKEDIHIARNAKVKSPVTVHACLPAFGIVFFARSEG